MKYQVRSEFEGDDDDEGLYSAPVRAAGAKKQKQKQSDLEINENNYPSF